MSSFLMDKSKALMKAIRDFGKSGNKSSHNLKNELCPQCSLNGSILKDCYSALNVLEAIIIRLTGTNIDMQVVQFENSLDNLNNEKREDICKKCNKRILTGKSNIVEELRKLVSRVKYMDLNKFNERRKTIDKKKVLITLEILEKKKKLLIEIMELHGLTIDLITSSTFDRDILYSDETEFGSYYCLIPNINSYSRVLVIGKKWRNITRAFISKNITLFYTSSFTEYISSGKKLWLPENDIDCILMDWDEISLKDFLDLNVLSMALERFPGASIEPRYIHTFLTFTADKKLQSELQYCSETLRKSNFGVFCQNHAINIREILPLMSTSFSIEFVSVTDKSYNVPLIELMAFPVTPSRHSIVSKIVCCSDGRYSIAKGSRMIHNFKINIYLDRVDLVDEFHVDSKSWIFKHSVCCPKAGA